MKIKTIVPLAVGLVIGIFAIRQTMNMIRDAKGSQQEVELMSVTIAKTDIPEYAQITAEMVTVTQTPKTPLLPRDAFSDPNALIDRVTIKSVPAGVPILASMIGPPELKPGIWGRVEDGYRAVSVKIDEATGVAYLVSPGDWVDVLAVLDQNRNGKRETVSKVILQRVQVAAIGQVLNSKAEEPGSRRAQTATLIVKVDDVPKLHMAQTRGRITLALRGQDDTVIADLGPTEEEIEEAEKEKEKELAAAKPPPVETYPEILEPPPAAPKATVLVVNSTSTAQQVEPWRVTFRDRESLEIMSVDRGAAPSAEIRLMDANATGKRKPLLPMVIENPGDGQAHKHMDHDEPSE